MTTPETLSLLHHHAFFAGFEQRDLEALAEHCRVVEFPNHTTIFEEFERAKEVYFVIDGQISIAICDASGCRQITMVGKGELLGWSPLIGRSRLFDTARAATKVRALVFDGDDLLSYCRSNAEFGFEFMRRAAAVLGERLAATRIQLLELSGVHFPEVPLESD
jgi:CRP/FNR family transcriptional regulator, cyclic AMP receptor protein